MSKLLLIKRLLNRRGGSLRMVSEERDLSSGMEFVGGEWKETGLSSGILRSLWVMELVT